MNCLTSSTKVLFQKILFLAINFSIIACANTDTKVAGIHEKGSKIVFKENQHINLKSCNINLPYGRPMAILDTFLLVSNANGEYNLDVYGINSTRRLNRLIKRGNEKGQLLHATHFLQAESEGVFWLFDSYLQKFLKINLAKANSFPSYLSDSEFTLNSFTIDNPEWINENLFAGTTLMTDDSRYLEFDCFNKIKKKVGTLPKSPVVWPGNPDSKISVPAFCYSGLIKRKPGEEGIAILYKYTDRIEIYEKGQLKRTIDGPGKIDSNFTFEKTAKGFFIPHFAPKSNLGYIDLAVSHKNIYALYSGKQRLKSNKIQIFDWNGKPLRQIILDTEISKFAIKELKNGDLLLFALNDQKLLNATINL